MKGMLIYKSSSRLTKDNAIALGEVLKPMADEMGLGCFIMDVSDEIKIEYDIGDLVAAIHAQTEAITRLAKSNEAMVDIIAQDQEQLDDGVQREL